MPPNKKAQQNAFYYYMIDLMRELKQEGYSFPNGLADVVPIAGPKWKTLTVIDKAPYEEQARKAKHKNNNADGSAKKDTRLDCTGLLISERLEPVDELSRRFQLQEQDITRTWDYFHSGNEILNTKFCFINFQTMCKTMNNEYLPLEVAVIKYSMNDGIIKEFHQFINAGEIPVGYRYEAQVHSDSTHKIPVENFELAQSNYRELWLKLVAFAEEAEFFCLSKDFQEMEFCLDWIHCQSGTHTEPIKLYALEKLVMDLFKFANHPVAKYQILDMLTTTAFDYEPNTRCAWHEENGSLHCSLAIIRRFAYAMSDSLTNVYDFNLTARHLPVKDQRMKGITLNPAKFGSKKSGTFRQNLQRNSNPTTIETVMSSDSSDDDDDDDDKSEPDLQALRMPLSAPFSHPTARQENYAGGAAKNSYFRRETNFPSLGRGSSHPERMLLQQTATTDNTRRQSQQPKNTLISVNPNPPEASRTKSQQTPSLAAATLKTTTTNPNSHCPVPGGAWGRPQKLMESQVVPSLENFPTLSSVTTENTKTRKPGRGPQGVCPVIGGQTNTTPLCFAAMAGRGRGRGIKPGFKPRM